MATILVIDDQEPLHKLLRTVLEGAGHEVTEAPPSKYLFQVWRQPGRALSFSHERRVPKP